MRRARRLTRLMLNVFLVFVGLAIPLGSAAAVSQGTIGPARLVPAAAVTLVFAWLYLRITRAIIEGRYLRREVAASGLLAFVAAMLGGAEPFAWGLVIIAWLSVAAIGVSRRTAVLISSAGVLAGMTAAGFNLYIGSSLMAIDMSPAAVLIQSAVFYVLMAVLLPPSNRLWVWFYQLAVKAHEGQEAKANLAVAEERLRFSRDLHDLVGHQLSAIALKAELAVRLSRADTEAAAAEMGEVHNLTRKALKELRQAVRGYRELDLGAELNSVKGVLEAAGVTCELHLPYRDTPDGVAPVFAYVVREAVTNVLKHSTASRCDITIRFTDEQASLEVRNDGVSRRPAEDIGSGLTGMAERLAAVGGKVTARPASEGEFVLTAEVALPLCMESR